MYLFLQARPNVTLEDVVMLSECCPSGRDPSLNLRVLVFVCGVVSLCQADVAFNVLYLRCVDIIYYIGVSISIIILDLFIVRS